MEMKYHRYDVTEIYVFSLNMLELCMTTAMPRIFVPENVFIYTFDGDCDKFRNRYLFNFINHRGLIAQFFPGVINAVRTALLSRIFVLKIGFNLLAV
jgi:hypothetical protein